MTLTERLREFEGSHGDYEWSVVVWRSDTLALANLRVRLKIYRVREHSLLWYTWTTRSRIYMETEVATDAGVADDVQDLQEKARQVAERFEDERRAVEEVESP